MILDILDENRHNPENHKMSHLDVCPSYDKYMTSGNLGVCIHYYHYHCYYVVFVILVILVIFIAIFTRLHMGYTTPVKHGL